MANTSYFYILTIKSKETGKKLELQTTYFDGLPNCESWFLQ